MDALVGVHDGTVTSCRPRRHATGKRHGLLVAKAAPTTLSKSVRASRRGASRASSAAAGWRACTPSPTTKFGKRAAIKIAHRSILGDNFTADTFLREARIVHRVDHPAVIDVFATGSCDGRPVSRDGALAGMTLGQRVDHGPPIARREAIEILLELCDVLRAAHDAGIVHRDLKLDNVFICDKPFADSRRVKLLDWGVAHVEGETIRSAASSPAR